MPLKWDHSGTKERAANSTPGPVVQDRRGLDLRSQNVSSTPHPARSLLFAREKEPVTAISIRIGPSIWQRQVPVGPALSNERFSRLSGSFVIANRSGTGLAHAIYKAGLKYIAAGTDAMALSRGAQKAVDAVVEELGRMSKTVKANDKDQIARVASIAGNNDPESGGPVGEPSWPNPETLRQVVVAASGGMRTVTTGPH